MDELKSKSQKKRDADALQDLGVKLIELSQTKLDSLPLPAQLRQAIIDARAIKSHGAKRRQHQLIGKLMRASETEPIIEAYQAIISEENAKTADFHDLEHWRDRLINEGNGALTAFVDQYQPADLQQLRQLIKKAVDDKAHEKNTGASRALFRFLRSCL